MAKNEIFIPKKCRVGFQHRDDTFTGKLAYVIYYDAQGKIRKERSWTNWCHLPGSKRWNGTEQADCGIEPYDFDNEPTSGFVLNKGVRRYNWSHFGSGRSMIRIYDPRGVEFEITPDNLIGLLMHTDCRKREIQGELVYAWCNGELMLLPCASEEYEAAKDYTKLQGKKVSARELIKGATYITKKQDNLVYLGRHMWYDLKGRWNDDEQCRQGSKQHIFCDLEGENFKPIKSVPSVIASVVEEHCNDNYANWVDKYLQETTESAPIVEWITEPISDEEWNADHRRRGGSVLSAYMRADGGGFYSVYISEFQKSDYYYYSTPAYQEGTLVYTIGATINDDGSENYQNEYYYNRHHDNYNGMIQESDRSKFFHLTAKYENGLTKKWK